MQDPAVKDYVCLQGDFSMTRRDLLIAAAGSAALTSPFFYGLYQMTKTMLAYNAVKNNAIDCSADPLNIRPPFQTILNAQNWILDRLPEDKPLVIIMGEAHGYTLNALLEQAVIRGLHQQQSRHPERSLAVSIECPSNFSEIKHYSTPKDDQSRRQDNVESFKRDGFFIAGYDGCKEILEFCEEANIPTGFHDITMTSEKRIIAASSESRRAINSYHINITGQIVDTESRDHMAVRNLVGVENSISLMRTTGAKTLVVIAGAAHVVGYKNFPYKESLTALFLEKGFAVLPVNMVWDEVSHNIAKEGLQALAEGVAINGMSRRISDHEDRRHTLYQTTRGDVNAASHMNLN